MIQSFHKLYFNETWQDLRRLLVTMGGCNCCWMLSPFRPTASKEKVTWKISRTILCVAFGEACDESSKIDLKKSSSKCGVTIAVGSSSRLSKSSSWNNVNLQCLCHAATLTSKQKPYSFNRVVQKNHNTETFNNFLAKVGQLSATLKETSHCRMPLHQRKVQTRVYQCHQAMTILETRSYWGAK